MTLASIILFCVSNCVSYPESDVKGEKVRELILQCENNDAILCDSMSTSIQLINSCEERFAQHIAVSK